MAETGQKMKISKIAAPLFKIPTRSPPQPNFTVLGAPSSPNLVVLAKNGPFLECMGNPIHFAVPPFTVVAAKFHPI